MNSKPIVNEDILREKARILTDLGVWPGTLANDLNRWLEQFGREDNELAVNLGDAFVYWDDRLIDHLFENAVQRLSSHVCQTAKSYDEAKTVWAEFLDGLVVSYVSGDETDPTESGRTTGLRRVKTILRLGGQVVEPEYAAARLQELGSRNLLLVDDIVGTGAQVKHTWERALQGRIDETDTTVWVCTALATTRGIERIRSLSPVIQTSAGAVLDQRFNSIVEDGDFWPQSLSEAGPQFIRSASERIGIPPEVFPLGFQDAGLAIAWGDAAPDLTIGLIRFSGNGWTPLYPGGQ